MSDTQQGLADYGLPVAAVMADKPRTRKMAGTGSSRGASGEVQPEEWYQEPQSFTRALILAEENRYAWTDPFDESFGEIYDPACGEGRIVDCCLDAGYQALGTDLIDRAGGRFGVRDFTIPPRDDECGVCDTIITNPPYTLAQIFVEHGLRVARRRVIILHRLAWGFEGVERGQWIDQMPLARFYSARKRISMPPAGRGITPKNGSTAFAWFVFEHGHHGEPIYAGGLV